MKLKSHAFALLLLFFTLPAFALSSLKPESETRFQQAVDAFETEDLSLALKLFIEVYEENPRHLDSIIYLTRTYARQEQLDEAKELIELALQLAPENAQVQNLSGRVYGVIARDASIFTALGYAEESLKGFSKAVELEPQNLDYRQGLMRYHLNAPSMAGGDKKVAMEQAKAIAKLDEKIGFIALSEVYGVMEDKEALQSHYATISESLAKDPDIVFNHGMLQQSEELFEQANSSFRQAIELAAEREDFITTKFAAIYQLGRTSVLSKKQINDGISALDRYIEQAPDGENLPSKEWAEFRRANLLALNGGKKEAKTIYREIVSKTQDKRLKKAAKRKL